MSEIPVHRGHIDRETIEKRSEGRDRQEKGSGILAGLGQLRRIVTEK
jgi:hypothetical protein